MSDSDKPLQRDPVGATVDSVVGAIGLLWDWLGAPAKKAEPEPSIIGLLVPDTSEAPTEPAPPDVDGAIDTEGEEL